MASTISERLHWLLIDMGFFLSCSTLMYYNNKNAIQITHNFVFHEKTKHIEIVTLLIITFSMTISPCLLFLFPYKL